jgi:predicted RNA-binding protein YlxR (DUF448 family)
MTHQPERTCIGCRKVLKKDEVIRIIAGPAGIVIDYREKMTGRAAYVCPTRECINKSLAKESLSRAFKSKVKPPEADAFVSQLAATIKDKIKALLAISMKAGKLAAGASAVKDALEKSRVELLFFATDLSGGTREKLDVQGFGPLRQETLFTRDEFGALLGRELVGVVGILDKGLAQALWNETQRLKGLINVND